MVKLATSPDVEFKANAIVAYIVSLGFSDEKASKLRTQYLTQYGLTVRGLRCEHSIGSASLRFSSHRGVYFVLYRSNGL